MYDVWVILMEVISIMTKADKLTQTRAIALKETCATNICETCAFFNGFNCLAAAKYLLGNPRTWNIENIFPKS